MSGLEYNQKKLFSRLIQTHNWVDYICPFILSQLPTSLIVLNHCFLNLFVFAFESALLLMTEQNLAGFFWQDLISGLPSADAF